MRVVVLLNYMHVRDAVIVVLIKVRQILAKITIDRGICNNSQKSL